MESVNLLELKITVLNPKITKHFAVSARKKNYFLKIYFFSLISQFKPDS